GAADVRDEADCSLRHRELTALGDDAVATMPRKADAAAHNDAVHEGYVGLRIAPDVGVKAILVGPELAGKAGAFRSTVINGADVAAGAEPLVTRTIEDDDGDLGILLPAFQRIVDGHDHRIGQRVERLRSVHGDAPGVSLSPDNDLFGSVPCHTPSSVMSPSVGCQRPEPEHDQRDMA